MKIKKNTCHTPSCDDASLVNFLRTYAPSINDLPEGHSSTLEHKVMMMIKQDRDMTFGQRLMQFLHLYLYSKVGVTIPLAGLTAIAALLFSLNYDKIFTPAVRHLSISHNIDNIEVESYLEENWTQLLSENNSDLWNSEVDEIMNVY